MSVQAIAWVLEHSPARLAARLVLLSIANHAKADGSGAWPSYETIATEAGISRRHAYRITASLVAEGHLLVEEGMGPKGTNLYTVVGTRDILSPDKSDTGETLGTSTPLARDKSSMRGVENVPRTVLEPSIEPPEGQSAASDDAPVEIGAVLKAVQPVFDGTMDHILRRIWKERPGWEKRLTRGGVVKLIKANGGRGVVEALEELSLRVRDGVKVDNPYSYFEAMCKPRAS